MKKKKSKKSPPLFPTPDEMAEIEGLHYVADDDPGYRRQPWGRGFTYLDPKGNRVQAEKLRRRFKALAIPPAWTDVWISASPNGHIQATGRDEKGRKQYIYHPRWEAVRDEVKFNHLLLFGEALPPLRLQVEEDLRAHIFSRQKMMALVVRLLDETLLRIGNVAYAAENGSYGLTTLQAEHTAVYGSRITFSFPGKGNKQQEVRVQDRRLAGLVQRCQQLPGQCLFQYAGGQGEYHPITSTDINDYLRANMGQDFTAKEFRTWGATVVVATELAVAGPAETERAAQKNVATAVKQAARALGNTPTICRRYYVHSAVFEAYESGELFSAIRAAPSVPIEGKEWLSEMETAVLYLLQSR